MSVLQDGTSHITLRQALENGACPNCGNRIEWTLGKTIQDEITGKHCDKEFTINPMNASIIVTMSTIEEEDKDKTKPKAGQQQQQQQEQQQPDHELNAREAELTKAYEQASTKKEKDQIKTELDEIKIAKQQQKKL